MSKNHMIEDTDLVIENSENFAEPPKEVTAFHDFIAGGVAGSASVIVGHPFDTIKVRLQTSTKSASMLSVANSFGGVSSLFRGMAAPLSTAAVVNAMIFSAYGTSSRMYETYFPSKIPKEEQAHDPWQKSFLCGAFAGFVQCFVIGPMEHIKCRLQIQKGPADSLYKGPLDAAVGITRNHGIKVLFRGFWSTCWREVPAFGLYFSTYDYTKDRVSMFLASRKLSQNATSDTHQQQEPLGQSHAEMLISSALAGGVSGALTWFVVYPIDVLKTRIQTMPLTATRTEISMWTVYRSIVAQHGYAYLFRGCGVTLLRAFPVNGTIFPVYEFTLMHIGNYGL